MLRRAALLPAALALMAFSASAADISGKWTFHVKFFLHNGDPWFQFQQSGENLTGTYHGHFGEAPLTGSVKGDKVEFTIADKQGTAVYSGDLKGDTMKGTAKYPLPLGTGHFEGQRSK